MSHALTWVRRLSEFVPEMTEIPLFGNAPPFDWHRLSSLLAARLEVKDLAIHPKEQAWREAEKMKEGLGTDPFIASVFWNPLEFPLYFAMSRADLDKFLAWMMHKKSKSPISEPLKEGFCRFLLLEVIDAASKITPLQKLTPQLGDLAEPLPETEAFCIDVELAFADKTCWGRLIISPSFRKKWIEHFSQTTSQYVSTDTAKATELVVGVKTGSVVLTQSEWKTLQPGDFLVLDKGSYDARKQTGIATLNIGSIPLFQVKIKQNKLELLDFAMTQEENMEKKSQAEEMVQPAEESSVAIKEIPLNVCVEIARFRITLDKLMHLNPGNMLDLPIHPDQGVSLTVNGKKIGRAELVHVGETLGLRILEVGK